MMQMMFAINTSQFQGERAVTCYTCHRGSAKPVSIPMVDSKAPYVSEARLAADPAAAGRTDLPSASDVIEKYIQAAWRRRRGPECVEPRRKQYRYFRRRPWISC